MFLLKPGATDVCRQTLLASTKKKINEEEFGIKKIKVCTYNRCIYKPLWKNRWCYFVNTRKNENWKIKCGKIFVVDQ